MGQDQVCGGVSVHCNVPWKPPKFRDKVKIHNKAQFGNEFANWCNI